MKPTALSRTAAVGALAGALAAVWPPSASADGGYMNLHLRGGGAFACPGTLDAWIIGYSAWNRKR
ncbi:hypothetical protein ACFVH6_20155 [Spirillospora sp. NPDC127200]